MLPSGRYAKVKTEQWYSQTICTRHTSLINGYVCIPDC